MLVLRTGACLRRTRSFARSARVGESFATGFTLVELSVILVVLTILSGMAVASLSGLDNSRRNVAATRVRTTLAFAQEWAMGSGRPTWVAFDVPNDSVSVYVEDLALPGKANRTALPDPLTRAPLKLQLVDGGTGLDSVDMDGTSELQFDTSGAPHDANGASLSADGTVELAGGLTVRVTKTTGLVSVD